MIWKFVVLMPKNHNHNVWLPISSPNYQPARLLLKMKSKKNKNFFHWFHLIWFLVTASVIQIINEKWSKYKLNTKYSLWLPLVIWLVHNIPFSNSFLYFWWWELRFTFLNEWVLELMQLIWFDLIRAQDSSSSNSTKSSTFCFVVSNIVSIVLFLLDQRWEKNNTKKDEQHQVVIVVVIVEPKNRRGKRKKLVCC